MNKTTLLLALLLLAGCARNEKASVEHEDTHEEQFERGPHRGRLLRDGPLQIEITIFESGVPPEFRVYPYLDGKPIAPQDVNLRVTLARFGGREDAFTFTPREDYLLGSGVVEEPHSFDVTVSAEHAGKQHTWSYASYEGRTTLDAAMAEAAGVSTAVAGGGVLRETLTLYGRIEANAERVRQVSARYPGVIRSVAKNIGDRVSVGEALAAVESNESLQTYTVTAPIAGIITERHANAGEATDNSPLFVVADFNSVWAELSVFPRDRAQLKAGQAVRVTAADGKANGDGRIDFIAPLGQHNQSLTARVTLDNREGLWTPEQFVTGAVALAEIPVPLAVPLAAVQTFRDWQVVFLNIGDSYEIRPLELGRNDGVRVEVLSGLEPGDRYVSANSYLIKADIEKSGATHDH